MEHTVISIRIEACNHAFNCKLGEISFDDLAGMPCPICYKKSLWDKWKQEMLNKHKIKSLSEGSFRCLKKKVEKRPKFYWSEKSGKVYKTFKHLKNIIKHVKENEKFFYRICFKLNGLTFKYPLSVFEERGSYWVFGEAQSMSRILK